MTTPPHDDPVGNAWQIHAALTTWTANVDNKSSFALGLETGLLAGAVALRGSDNFLQTFNNDGSRLLWAIAVVLLGFAVMLTSLVVAPRLNSRKLGKDLTRDYIYFGHLSTKYAGPAKTDDLVAALKAEPVLDVIARQLQIMGKIAWQKHRRLQIAMIAGTVGALCLGISLVVN